MSSIARLVSLSAASAAVVGLVVALELAPPAAAEPCSPPEANVEPPAASTGEAPPGAAPSPGQLPIGRMPRGANEHAPLPRLGPLVSSLLHPGAGNAAPLRQQAAAIPPNPPEVNSQTPPPAAQPVPEPAAVPPASDPGAALGGSRTSLVDWVSGPNSPNKTLDRFRISGTDLGIMWDNGDPINRQVLIAFGDTTGYCSVRGHQWRYNTMFRSQDHDLSDGLSVPAGVVNDRYSGSPLWAPGLSKQIISSIRRAPEETSVIPTAGISDGGRQYINFMSVVRWENHGVWPTNFSGIAMSPDNGQNWGIYPGSIRTPAPDSLPGARYVPGNENFQQGAFVRSSDGYIYSFGTPGGRGGSAFLARVPPGSVPDLTKYQYWKAAEDGSGSWVPGDPAAATPVIPGPVGEMSVQYNDYLKQYLVLYGNGGNNIVARTAPALQGPWSPEQMLVSQGQIPGGIYAPFLHPWATGKDVFFTLSLWSAYNVMLMHTELG